MPEVIKTTLTTEEKGELLPLKKDRLNSAGKYVKYIDEKGRIAKYGALFEVKLRVETVQGCAGNLIHLIYEVYQWDSEEETYLPVTQFQPWLMMTGHVLLMSANEAEINEKTFAHLHFMKSPGQRELIFDYFDRKKLSGKTVKAWLQFKVDEKVQKVPFTFDYTSSYRATCD